MSTRDSVQELLRKAQLLLEDAQREAFADQYIFEIGFLDRLHILFLNGQGLFRETQNSRWGIPIQKERDA